MHADKFTRETKKGFNDEQLASNDVAEFPNSKSNYLATVIIDLHEKGYVEDFVVSEKSLLWVQQQIYIAPKGFLIIERLRLKNHKKNNSLFILAVMATAENAKGIIVHYSNCALAHFYRCRIR